VTRSSAAGPLRRVHPDRNRLSRQAVRLAVAVPAFMVVAHAGGDLGRELRGGDDPLTFLRMSGELETLAVDVQSHVADVVEESGRAQVVEMVRREARVLADCVGDGGHPARVPACDRAAVVDCVRHRHHHLRS
jgi:hypothetical protein